MELCNGRVYQACNVFGLYCDEHAYTISLRFCQLQNHDLSHLSHPSSLAPNMFGLRT